MERKLSAVPDSVVTLQIRPPGSLVECDQRLVGARERYSAALRSGDDVERARALRAINQCRIWAIELEHRKSSPRGVA